MIVVWIIIGIVVLAAIFVWVAYNGLVTNKNRVDEAWADIQVQLKRRHDLIPNLVETVKGYAAHEKKVFEDVTKARAAATAATTPEEQAKTENALSGALRSVFAVAEGYPELKASQNFLELQTELSDTENKIQAARRFYNGQVRDFNTKLQVFPTNMFAKNLGFTARDFFELDEPAEAEPVAVKF